MPQKTKIHWHLTWDGVECPRVRVTDEPVTHDDRDTPYWRQQERWEILQREAAAR